MNLQNSKIKECLLIIAFLFILLLLALLNHPIPCIFNKVTGLYCPGCGITRMIMSILNLDLIKAFNHNQLCFLYLTIGIIYLIYSGILIILKKEIKKIPDNIYIVLLIIAIIFGILRNLSWCFVLKP